MHARRAFSPTVKRKVGIRLRYTYDVTSGIFELVPYSGARALGGFPSSDRSCKTTRREGALVDTTQTHNSDSTL